MDPFPDICGVCARFVRGWARLCSYHTGLLQFDGRLSGNRENRGFRRRECAGAAGSSPNSTYAPFLLIADNKGLDSYLAVFSIIHDTARRVNDAESN